MYLPMPNDLADLVRTVQLTNIGTKDQPKFVPSMSAVITNIRNKNPGKSRLPPRFWYMLPPFYKTPPSESLRSTSK